MNRARGPVLLACVSANDTSDLELTLAEDGWEAHAVADATEAAGKIRANGESPMLLIDSGLLEANHDPQWRALRVANPHLGVVVRCLLPRGKALRENGRTMLVPPDSREAICQALSALSCPLA